MTRSRLALLAVAVAIFVVGAATGATLLARDGADSGDSAGATAAAATTDHGGMHPVAGTFEPDETELEDCADGDSKCLEQAFANVAFRKGPEEALAAFDTAIANDPDVEAGCHRIAHMIGSAALAGLEGNVAQAFARGSASCWSGYYHGILERAFNSVSSRDEVAGVARGLCDDAEIKETTFLLYQCVHGLGHGLMIYSGYDLPYSLSICDALATDWDQTSCTGGVFMENISTSYGVKSKWVRDDDPVYPCQTVKERHKLYCYLMVTSRINELNGFDWEETAATCKRVEKDWVATCFESYGRDASGNSRQDPPTVARLCEHAKPFASSCVYGAARDMTSNYANGERASELCGLIQRSLRAQCFHGIGTILGNLGATDAEKRKLCVDVTPPAYLPTCLAGTGLAVEGG
jgi:hypothetical protein